MSLELEHSGRRYRLFALRGHPRSGTNWLGAVLNLHPRIACMGKYHFDRLLRAADEWRSFVTGMEGSLGEQVAQRVAEGMREACLSGMLPQIETHPEADWQGDRSPCRLQWMLQGLPTFHIVRDGRDVLVSQFFHTLRKGIGPGHSAEWRRMGSRSLGHYVEHPCDLLDDESLVRTYAKRWGDWVLADREIVERSNGGVGPAPIHSITYEALHREPERVRAGLYRFLSLDPEEARPLSSEDRTSPGHGRENPNSFYRLGEVGSWRKHFSGDACRWFNEEAGRALVELGYETSGDWAAAA